MSLFAAVGLGFNPAACDQDSESHLPDAESSSEEGSLVSEDGGTEFVAEPLVPSEDAICQESAFGLSIDCTLEAKCPAIGIVGDSPAGIGKFSGYADPTIACDPSVPGRVWLAYSWPHLVTGKALDGSTVTMAAVSSHLARSDDQGKTFSFDSELFKAIPLEDPEGSGEQGILSSETVSLAAMVDHGTTTWYAAHLRYFLEPKTGYNPKYATGWTVRVKAADSPPHLSEAGEAVLGVSQTAVVYNPDARLDQLAGLPVQHCGMLNNPTLFAQEGTLYLIVECLAFVGQTLDHANSTTQVFATVPEGAPSAWAWRYVGKLGDHSLAQELQDDTIQQPDVSLADDGTLLAILTPAHADSSVQVGTVGDGCVAIELTSIDPPTIRRDCAGRAVVRASILGTGLGACTHDAASLTGIVPTTQSAEGGNWMVRASGLMP